MEKETLTDDSLEILKKELVRGIIEQQRINENSKYGEFIIQANEIQFYLVTLIWLRSFFPINKLEERLERLEFGNLIICFRICIRNRAELVVYNSLNDYKDKRNKLAHKMFTDKKLTIKECELAIKFGKKLIVELKKLIDERIKEMKKGSSAHIL